MDNPLLSDSNCFLFRVRLTRDHYVITAVMLEGQTPGNSCVWVKTCILFQQVLQVLQLVLF